MGTRTVDGVVFPTKTNKYGVQVTAACMSCKWCMQADKSVKDVRICLQKSKWHSEPLAHPNSNGKTEVVVIEQPGYTDRYDLCSEWEMKDGLKSAGSALGHDLRKVENPTRQVEEANLKMIQQQEKNRRCRDKRSE